MKLTLLLLPLALFTGWLVAAPSSQETQQAQEADPWQAFDWLVGSWQGQGKGPAGESRLERTYEKVLGHFLHSRTLAQFTDEDGEPSESHGDIGMFSYDKDREVFVLREFYSEGFVNTFDHEASEEGKIHTFTSAHIENFQPGWRARYTLTRTADDVFEETLELAGPEKDWFTCVTGSFERAR